MWEKLQNIDVRIIYLLMTLSIVLPLLFPLGLPVEVTPLSQEWYDMVDTLEPGQFILLSSDHGPGTLAENRPQIKATALQAFAKGIRVVGFGQWELGVPSGYEAISEAAAVYNKEYGVDWVHWGWKPGGVILLRGMINDLWGNLRVDINGVPFEQLPIMDELRRMGDIHMVASFDTGSSGSGEWITYVGTPSMNPGPQNADGFMHRVPILCATTSVNVPSRLESKQADLLSAVLAGGGGAAEYELLIGHPGEGIASMDAQSMGHLMIILFVILGNVGFLVVSRKK